MEIIRSATKLSLIVSIIGVIVLNLLQIEVSPTLNTVVISITAFYFGQKKF